MAGGYFLVCCLLEKCGNFWKNGRFSGRIWPDWGNTTRADMVGLGSIGLTYYKFNALNNSLIPNLNSKLCYNL